MKYVQPVSTLFAVWTLLLGTIAGAAEHLVVSGNPEAPPIVWEKSGQLTGIGPQLVASFLDQEGVAYTLRPEGTWDEVQDKARAGSIDLIVSAYDNRERREYLDYSIPYLKSPVVIVVKKGNGFPLHSWSDLAGKKGVANTGESFGSEFDAYIKEKLDVAYVPYERAFAMLAEESADYLVIDLYPAVIYAKLLRAEESIEYLDNPVSLQHFHVTIAKNSPYQRLLPNINAYIQQMQDKGEINRMLQEQYQAWHQTFRERERLFERAGQKAEEAQAEFDATARDRGLDNLMRFVEMERPYMFN